MTINDLDAELERALATAEDELAALHESPDWYIAAGVVFAGLGLVLLTLLAMSHIQ